MLSYSPIKSSDVTEVDEHFRVYVNAIAILRLEVDRPASSIYTFAAFIRFKAFHGGWYEIAKFLYFLLSNAKYLFTDC